MSVCITNESFAHPDEQCQEGYRGALCLVCADGWVPGGASQLGCVKCDGGAQLYLAFLAMFGFSLLVGFVLFLVLVCSVKEEKIENARSALGQFKIIIAYVQIMVRVGVVVRPVFFVVDQSLIHVLLLYSYCYLWYYQYFCSYLCHYYY